MDSNTKTCIRYSFEIFINNLFAVLPCHDGLQLNCCVHCCLHHWHEEGRIAGPGLILGAGLRVGQLVTSQCHVCHNIVTLVHCPAPPPPPGGCGRYVVLMSCQVGIAAELVVIEYGTFRFKVFKNLLKVECIISLHFMV